MADLQKIVDDLSSLTVLEAAELAKLLEEKWGVSAAAAVAVAGPAAAAAAPAEEKTEFTVGLAAAGDKRIEVINKVWGFAHLTLESPRSPSHIGTAAGKHGRRRGGGFPGVSRWETVKFRAFSVREANSCDGRVRSCARASFCVLKVWRTNSGQNS